MLERGGDGFILSYDRSGSAYLPLNIDGNVIRLNNNNTSGVAVGLATPRGKFHVHDGLGGALFHSQLGITSSVTIIPDAAGDVQYGLHVTSVVLCSDGNVQASAPAGAILPGAFVDLYANGGDTFRLSVSAGGAVTVARTAGTRTYAVALWLLWL